MLFDILSKDLSKLFHKNVNTVDFLDYYLMCQVL